MGRDARRKCCCCRRPRGLVSSAPLRGEAGLPGVGRRPKRRAGPGIKLPKLPVPTSVQLDRMTLFIIAAWVIGPILGLWLYFGVQGEISDRQAAVDVAVAAAELVADQDVRHCGGVSVSGPAERRAAALEDLLQRAEGAGTGDLGFFEPNGRRQRGHNPGGDFARRSLERARELQRRGISEG